MNTNDKCQILAYILVMDTNLTEFKEYHDLALPIGYLVSNGYVELNDKLAEIVDKAFDELLVTLNVDNVDNPDSLIDLIDQY